MDIQRYTMMKIKIHQYNEDFIQDLRFWVETEVDNMFTTTWVTGGRLHCPHPSKQTGLLVDNNIKTKFYYNKELDEYNY